MSEVMETGGWKIRFHPPLLGYEHIPRKITSLILFNLKLFQIFMPIYMDNRKKPNHIES
jgi:hypothetical protein